ncbi:hypothetical protein CPB86DRAFT_479373 [Serendipita vermifera]|nr:hypothetical protein CPB86DRAFT_479373 [Serendipita vermifera]
MTEATFAKNRNLLGTRMKRPQLEHISPSPSQSKYHGSKNENDLAQQPERRFAKLFNESDVRYLGLFFFLFSSLSFYFHVLSNGVTYADEPFSHPFLACKHFWSFQPSEGSVYKATSPSLSLGDFKPQVGTRRDPP